MNPAVTDLNSFWSCIGGAAACVVGLALVAMTVQHRDAEAIRREVRSLGLDTPTWDLAMLAGTGCLALLLIPLLLAAKTLGHSAITIAPMVMLAVICVGCGLLSVEGSRRYGVCLLFAAIPLAAGLSKWEMKWGGAPWLASHAPAFAIICLVIGLFGSLLVARILQTGFWMRVSVTPTYRLEVHKALFDLTHLCTRYASQLATAKAQLKDDARLQHLGNLFFKEAQIEQVLEGFRKIHKKVCSSPRLPVGNVLRDHRGFVELREEIEDQLRRLQALSSASSRNDSPSP